MYLAHAGCRLAELPRVRRHGLLPRESAVRNECRLPALHDRRAPSWYPRPGRSRAQPHVGPAPALPGGTARHHVALPRMVPLVAHEAERVEPVGTEQLASVAR